MNSYLANMPRKGLSKFLEEDEKRKEEEAKKPSVYSWLDKK